jgi:hypothetical protein
MKKVFFILIILYSSHQTFAQSLIVGMPSADVAEKGHLEITHETQWNFWQSPQKWNSFNFACYGLGKGVELTSTVNNINNDGSQNLAIGVGAKKVFNLKNTTDPFERKLIIGGNILYSTQNRNIGQWTYGLLSSRVPSTKTRFTGGFSYGNSQTFGFTTRTEGLNTIITPNNRFVVLAGIEQPLFNNVSFICDWYSGSHDLAATIPALQIDLGHHVLIFGYKIPNNKQSGNQALIIEAMISIPTRK